MQLRNGRVLPVDMPEIGNDMATPAHYILPQVQRNRHMLREARGLGLIQEAGHRDLLTEEAIANIREPEPVQAQMNFGRVAIDPERCSEILWKKGQNPTQCRGRPMRGEAKCWRHNGRTAHPRTLERQDTVMQRIRQLRADNQRRQHNERAKYIASKRFQQLPQLPEEPDRMANNVETSILRNWQLHGHTNADLEAYLNIPVRLPDDMRHHFHHPYFPTAINIDDRIEQEQQGLDEDSRVIVRDVASVFVNFVRDPRVVYVKCCLCHLFSYPVETAIVPEKWTLKCRTCDNRAHRHCQETVPPFYHDEQWQCPLCAVAEPVMC